MVLSLSPLSSTFTAPLVDALIGGGSEPLDWLEYARTAEEPPRRRRAFLAMLIAVVSTAALTAAGLVLARRSGAGTAR